MNLLENPFIFIHVVFGSIAVLVGFIALVVKKGAATHIKFGHWFAWTMMISSLLGAMMGLANYTEFLITAFAGILSTTLIASSLLTLKIQSSNTVKISFVMIAINCLNLLCISLSGAIAVTHTDGSLFGFLAEDYFFLAAMAMVALIGDIKYLLTKDIQRHQKIARHLWRMCLGFFMAAGSAFTGPGMSAFPAYIQESGILHLPELLIFIVSVFWFTRILFFSKTTT